MQGARSSVAMVLTLLLWNIPVSAPERLKQYSSSGVNIFGLDTKGNGHWSHRKLIVVLILSYGWMDNCPCRKYSGYLHRLLGTLMRSILLKILYSKFKFSSDTCICYDSILAISSILIARFMGPTWGPSGADRTQVGPMLAPWTLLSGTTKCLHVQLVMQLLNVQKFAIITCFNLDMRKIMFPSHMDFELQLRNHQWNEFETPIYLPHVWRNIEILMEAVALHLSESFSLVMWGSDAKCIFTQQASTHNTKLLPHLPLVPHICIS